MIRLISALADRGIPVGHQYANYTVAALHGLGLAAVIHHLGWVDKGEPAEEQGFRLRSRQSYVPGVRHTLRFPQAEGVGRQLDAREYADATAHAPSAWAASTRVSILSTSCSKERIPLFSPTGKTSRTATTRAVAANTWHYLLRRRLEIQAFSAAPAVDVISRDIERAALLTGDRDSDRLRRLATELQSA